MLARPQTLIFTRSVSQWETPMPFLIPTQSPSPPPPPLCFPPPQDSLLKQLYFAGAAFLALAFARVADSLPAYMKDGR